MDPIHLKHAQTMKDVAEQLNHIFAGSGFCLFVFDFGENARINYVSNADRADMIAAMKEYIARCEAEGYKGNEKEI